MEGFHCLVTALVAAMLRMPPRGAALQEPLGSALHHTPELWLLSPC